MRGIRAAIGAFLTIIASILVENGVEKAFLEHYEAALDRTLAGAELNERQRSLLRLIDEVFRACLENVKRNRVN